MAKGTKKKTAKKKLTLGKETVRKLSDKELGGVAGGVKRPDPDPGTVRCGNTMDYRCAGSDPSACCK
ncbi:MAG: class I lanthipeptide [Myxococcales bacterium]|nr:class I lanthipeptide [Myxococcales bacterium]